jgi:hypothetical protein
MKRYLPLIAALAYLIWPYDALVDLLPGWGWIDDAIIAYLAFRYLRSHFTGSRQSRGQTADRDGQADGPGQEPPRHDPYSILGVTPDAGPEEIRRAYRRLANQYHPDKVNHLGKEFREMAENRFKEIQAAYDELRRKKG